MIHGLEAQSVQMADATTLRNATNTDAVEPAGEGPLSLQVGLPEAERMGSTSSDDSDDSADGKSAGSGGSDSGEGNDGLDDDNTEDDDEGSDGDEAQRKGFIAGGKALSFSKAFAKIIGRHGEASSSAALILKDARSVKRSAEDDATTTVDKEAKRVRLEMKQRCHKVVSLRGEDPAADAMEKMMQKIATRGVVQLFNAVSKAQKEAKDSLLNGIKGRTGMSKAAFFQQLKQGQTNTKTQAKQKRGGGSTGGQNDAGDEGEGKGWDVLKQGFTGLKSRHILKDWDKQEASDKDDDEQIGEEELSDSDSEGW